MQTCFSCDRAGPKCIFRSGRGSKPLASVIILIRQTSVNMHWKPKCLLILSSVWSKNLISFYRLILLTHSMCIPFSFHLIYIYIFTSSFFNETPLERHFFLSRDICPRASVCTNKRRRKPPEHHGRRGHGKASGRTDRGRDNAIELIDW